MTKDKKERICERLHREITALSEEVMGASKEFEDLKELEPEQAATKFRAAEHKNVTARLKLFVWLPSRRILEAVGLDLEHIGPLPNAETYRLPYEREMGPKLIDAIRRLKEGKS